jgi:hypothetical protein
MANIALTTANKVEVVESLEQMTLPAAEAITAGAIVRIDTAGKFTNANGSSTTENDLYGVATRTVAAGIALTAIRRGVMDGYVFTQAYNTRVYASDTDGRIADAAGTASKVVGRVIPSWATTRGTAADKLLLVEVGG